MKVGGLELARNPFVAHCADGGHAGSSSGGCNKLNFIVLNFLKKHLLFFFLLAYIFDICYFSLFLLLQNVLFKYRLLLVEVHFKLTVYFIVGDCFL